MYAPRGVVTTSQPLAASAGVDVIHDDGNAFDAAITAPATLAVVKPMSTGLGGDIFALFRTADGAVGGVQGCGGAPGQATIDRMRELVGPRTRRSRTWDRCS
ncbi:gamma-glutamyltransferase [Halorubrum trueperi]